MRCLGRTRTLRRCSRQTRFLFCHDHRWVSVASAIAFLVLMAEFRDYYLIPLRHWLTPPRPLRLSLRSGPAEAPTYGEQAVPAQILQNRRYHILELSNPNRFPLNALDLYTQFPESILSITSPPSASYNVVAAPQWDSVPVQLGGTISNAPPFEPYATAEATGLWHVTINTIPPQTTIPILIVTALGAEGGLYAQAVIDFEGQKTEQDILWFVRGDYMVRSGDDSAVDHIFATVAFDRGTRAAKVLGLLTESMVPTNTVRLRHGRGFRLPGVLRTSGYVFGEASGDRKFWTASPIMERTNDIAVAFGLFGSPLQPGVWLKVRSP
jgi:hypothetical protein